MRRILERWLRRAHEQALRWALGRLSKEGIAKADDAVPNPTDLVDDLEDAMIDAVKAGTREAGMMIGIDFDTPPAAALRYARERAAEMVGMKANPDGTLIPNPNARFQIAEDLRGLVRETVSDAIEEGWSPQRLTSELSSHFDPWRAETIARTETGNAYNEGAIEVYRESGMEYVEIVDGDGCLPEGHDDGAGTVTDPEKGQVYIELQANGQIWTLEQFQQRRLGHPNCVRAGVPYVAASETAA